MPSADSHLSLIAIRTARAVIGTVVVALTCSCDAQTPPATPGDPEFVAKQVVAGFLSVPAADITLVSLTAQEFNDSSLGCPEPGMSYLQALTPGHRVIVEAEGRRFDIRVSAGHGRICRRTKSQTPEQEPGPRSPVSALIDLARKDLARHLQTEPGEITVLEVRPLTAQNIAEGCSPECNDPLKQCGYRIGLLHDGRRYEYHANQERVAPCPPLSTI